MGLFKIFIGEIGVGVCLSAELIGNGNPEISLNGADIEIRRGNSLFGGFTGRTGIAVAGA